MRTPSSEARPASTHEANLIIVSRNVFTGVEARPRPYSSRDRMLPPLPSIPFPPPPDAEPAAVCVRDGRILAVVDPADIDAFRTPATRVVDYGDAFVCPGLHDAHVHAFHSALYASPLAENFLGESEADCVRRMRALAARKPQGWLLSQGWREYRWNPPVLPTKHSLDAAFPDRPVAMYSGDGHTLWLNSRALEELGVTRDSTPPQGGTYERDDAGELTGIVREAAAMELLPRIMASFSLDEVTQAYRGFLRRMASCGITAICDMSLAANPGMDFIRDDVWSRLLDAGELTARVHLFPTLTDDLSRFEAMRRDLRGCMLQACGFKQFFDGVSSQHTAYLKDPYTNARYPGDRGHLTVSYDRMRKLVLNANGMGYPVRIHAIGDEAIHLALNIFEEAERLCGRPSMRANGTSTPGRNTLEHLENLQYDDIERLARLGVVASVQPPHITLDPGGPERDLGPERCRWMWPFGTYLDEGVQMAFGTDAPVVDINPMAGLYTAVTRKDATTHEPDGGWLPEERIPMRAALSAYTYGSACAAGVESMTGTLEAGMAADIAVFDRDLTGDEVRLDPELILDTHAIATFVAERQVFGE
ncbi:amidohydrolase [uncultured Slackia sp.]|uniref:amidohydrolase n=1 Tax=uncultured Slackia sp. TaxID=665903 RepID=UPI0025ECB6D7|nr:amidohydrolase [uncultured Slackia sp.]